MRSAITAALPAPGYLASRRIFQCFRRRGDEFSIDPFPILVPCLTWKVC